MADMRTSLEAGDENNERLGLIRRVCNNGIFSYLKTKLTSNADLKDVTLWCMKLCLGGALYKGIASQNVDMSVGKEPLMFVAEAATMGGLVACVNSIMRWRNEYTRATDILAKTGCSLTVAAISIMFFLRLPNIFAWVVPMLVVGLTIPGILMA